MKPTKEPGIHADQDGLRLLGISRIPRCRSCDRLAALMTAYRSHRAVTIPLPPRPPGCDYAFCAAMVERLARSTPDRESAGPADGASR